MKNINIILLIIALCSLDLFSQPAQIWEKLYNNPNGIGTDASEKTVTDAMGNIYHICGTRTNVSDDIMVLKYSFLGNLLWSRVYNYSFNGTEHANDICVDNSGNVYVTGTSTRSMDGYDAILLKYDANGTQQWVRRINKSNYSDRECEGVSLVVQGSIYVGITLDYNGFSECGIVKYNPNGDSVAYLSLGSVANYTYGMVKLIYDNSSLSLYSICSGDLLPNENEDFTVKKIDINGSFSQVWSKLYTGTAHLDDRPYDIAVGPDGNVFVTGYTEVPNQGQNSLLLKMGRDDGAILFQKTYNDATANNIDAGNKISFDQNANIIIGGYTTVLNNTQQILLLKYSPAGAQTWVKKYEFNPEKYNWLKDMKTDGVGNIYFVFNSFSGPQQTTNLVISKFSSSGVVDWFIEKQYSTTSNGLNSLHILSDGSLVASGYTKDQNNTKTLTVKFGSTIGVEPVSNSVPEKFELGQNYPNPFNPMTNINFSLPVPGIVKLVVFDAAGKQVAELVNKQLSAGTYKADFDASLLSSGVYFYKLITNEFTEVKKMMLVK
jgi:hypothetical protein